MKHLYFTGLLLLCVISAGATGLRYLEPLFGELETMKGVEFAKAQHLNNLSPTLGANGYQIHDGEMVTEERPLLMDIYMPKGDTLTKRPLVILAHPGGFITGVRDDQEMNTWCQTLAGAGYVAATIDYRLGMGANIVWSEPFPGIKLEDTIKIEAVNARRAVYRAVQDGRAAIRYMKSKAAEYNLDTTRVYLVGSSAGGFIAIQNQYYLSNADIPAGALDDPSLGGLDAVGVQGYGAVADAYIALWGAIQHTDLIKNSSAPALLVHGTADKVVPFKDGYSLKALIPVAFQNQVQFNTDLSYGSYCIDTAMNRMGVMHETYFVEGKDHGFYGSPDGTPNEYADTIMNKALHFLHNLHKPMAGFTHTIDKMTASFSSSYGRGVVAVSWDFGDGNKSNEENPVHAYSKAGTYTATQVVYNEIASADTLSVSITIDSDTKVDAPWASLVSLSPNPANSFFTLQGVDNEASVRIHDLSGQLVYSQNHVVADQRLSTRDLVQGMYLVTIDVKGKRLTRKLVKN